MGADSQGRTETCRFKMDLYFILKYHHLAYKRMNEFMLFQRKHLTPYRIDTAQRLFHGNDFSSGSRK